MYDVKGDFLRGLTEAWSRIAADEVGMMVPPGFAFPLPATFPPPRRLRVGYTSSDLKRQHPVAHLGLGLPVRVVEDLGAQLVLQVHHGRAVFPTLLRLKTRPFHPDRFGTSIA